MAKIYEQIIRYIDKNLKEELTLDKIAKSVGYSKFHIYKLFAIYTAVPVMKYVRRKKMYAAVNEFYTGQNLYDIALDYNYETPAGFYKAFKSIFGCSPSGFKKHKLNDNKEILFMLIENVKTTEELDNVLEFAKQMYPEAIDMDGGGRYSRAYWLEQFNKQPELILYAKDGDKICGIALGCVDWGKNITIGGDGVLEEYKNKGVHEAMFIEIEKRGAKLKYEGIGLGIEDGQEEFYAKLGYVGKITDTKRKRRNVS
jgi:AraC-like DNA-binding protein